MIEMINEDSIGLEIVSFSAYFTLPPLPLHSLLLLFLSISFTFSFSHLLFLIFLLYAFFSVPSPYISSLLLSLALSLLLSSSLTLLLLPEKSTYTGDLLTLSSLFKSLETLRYCLEINQK